MQAPDKALLLELLDSLYSEESEYVIYSRQDLINIVSQGTNVETTIFFRQVLKSIVLPHASMEQVVDASINTISPLECH